MGQGEFFDPNGKAQESNPPSEDRTLADEFNQAVENL